MSKIEEHSQQQKAGMKCPQCGIFIETNIYELLTAQGLECPECHLKLAIDRTKSRPAMDALRKVQQAREELEQKNKFKG